MLTLGESEVDVAIANVLIESDGIMSVTVTIYTYSIFNIDEI